jgi:hypothetical protein
MAILKIRPKIIIMRVVKTPLKILISTVSAHAVLLIRVVILRLVAPLSRRGTVVGLAVQVVVAVIVVAAQVARIPVVVAVVAVVTLGAQVALVREGVEQAQVAVGLVVAHPVILLILAISGAAVLAVDVGLELLPLNLICPALRAALL